MTLAILAALLGGAVALLARSIAMSHQLARQITSLETLNEISQVLLTDRNLRGVLRLVAESAAKLLRADMAHVTLLAADGTRLVLEAATGPLTTQVGAVVPLEDSTAGYVVKNAQPLVLNDPAADGRNLRSLHERITLRGALLQPLIIRGRCVGALGVENPRGHRSFGSGDVAVLRDLANHTGLVIESIRAVDELASRERRAGLLNAVNSRIRQSLELHTILEAAVRELGTALGVSRCFVRLRRGNELLPVAAEWHAPDAAPGGARPDIALPLLVAAVRERRTVETWDARTDERTTGRLAEGEPAIAVLATPIVLRGEAIGVIAFHQVGKARHWRDDESGLVEEVAGEMAIAISNARLYRSAEDATRELALKIDELERANRLKAQFLANMSHELRTPLNSVIGFSEMLLVGAHGSVTDEQRDALDTIARNGRHLLGLVNDVLDLSKIEAGKMELYFLPIDIRALISDVMTGMESLIQAKGHRVSLEISEGPLVVVADEMRVRQILFNLLSNAVKFTPPGGQVVVRGMHKRTALPVAKDRKVERDAVWVAVSDTGIGIAPEDLPRLFTEFSQVDASYARRYEGTGLGLALCKRFVDLHGGTIGVESAAGQGSTFWVVLPTDGPQLAAAVA